MSQVRGPLAHTDLVGNQAVRRGAVRNAQERFGQAHEGDPFPVAKAVLRQEPVEHGPVGPVRAHGHDDCRGGVPDRRGKGVVERPLFKQGVDRALLGRELGAANRCTQSLKVGAGTIPHSALTHAFGMLNGQITQLRCRLPPVPCG